MQLRYPRSLVPALCLAPYLAVAALSASALGAEPPAAADSPNEKVVQLDPFSVNTSSDNSSFSPTDASSATRIAVDLRNLPMSVSVMTSALLTDIMPINIKDGLNYGPGISGGQVNRVSYSSDAAYRNIVTSATFLEGSTLLHSGIFDETFDIDRIEIIHGPSGTVFGPGNFGGLSNRVSKQPLFKEHGEAEVAFGSNGYEKFAVDYTAPVVNTNNKLAFRLVATYSRGPFSDKIDDHFIHDFIHASLTWAATPNTTVSANVKYRTLNGTLNLMGDYLVGGSTFANMYKFDTTKYDPLGSSPYTTSYKEFMAWVTVEHNVGSWLSLRTLAAVTKGTEQDNYAVPTPSGGYNPTPFINGSAGTTVPLPAGMLNGVYDDYTTISETSGIDQDVLVKYSALGVDTKTLVTFNVAGLSPHDYSGGQDRRRIGFYSWNYTNGPIGTPPSFSPYNPNSPNYVDPNSVLPLTWVIPRTKPSLSTTVQEFATFWDGKINVSGGYSRSVQHGSEIDIAKTAVTVQTDDFSANVIRYGASVTPLKWLTIFGQYNQGFSPPTPRVDPINHNVYGPSTSRDREGGVKIYLLKDRLTFSADVFRMDLGGIITPFPNVSTQGSFQSGGIIDNGWETTLAGEITPEWSITASVNQCDYVLANGRQNFLAARDYGNFYTKYTFHSGALENLSFGLGEWYKFRMVDGYFTDGNGNLTERYFPAAQVWSALVSYKWKRVTARLNVTNLFDKFYYNAESSGIYFRGDTRHVDFAVDYSF